MMFSLSRKRTNSCLVIISIESSRRRPVAKWAECMLVQNCVVTKFIITRHRDHEYHCELIKIGTCTINAGFGYITAFTVYIYSGARTIFIYYSRTQLHRYVGAHLGSPQQVNTPNSRQAYSIDIIDIAVCTYSVYMHIHKIFLLCWL